MKVEVYPLPSMSNPDVMYNVTFVDGVAVACGCGQFRYRAQVAGPCKHILDINNKHGIDTPCYWLQEEE